MRTTTRNALLGAAVVGVAFVGVAVANATFAGPDVTTPGRIVLEPAADANTGSATPPTADAASEAVRAGVDEGAAVVVAREQFGGGELVRVRAEREDGRDVWDVVLLADDGRLVEVEVDALDGTVVDVDEDDDVDDPRARDAASIDEERARTVALDHVGGGEVVRVLAERDDGRPEWSITVLTPDDVLLEVTVDAAEGVVVDVDDD